MARRVVLVGINYWPEHAGIAPYTAGLAEHLVRRGDSVTVITGLPHYPAWQVSDGYTGHLRMRERLAGVDVRRRWHYVPDRQSAVRRAAYEFSFFASSLPVSIKRPDAIIGIVPTLSGGLIARWLGARHRAPYGVLFQDLMGPAAAQSGMRGGKGVAAWTGRLERLAVSRAAAVGVVSEGFRPYLRGLGKPDELIFGVPNWVHVSPSHGDRQETRLAMGWAPEEQIVLHAGNMGLKQDLGQVIEAAREAAARRDPVHFVLMGAGSQRAALEAQAGSLPNVSFVDPVPEEQFASVLGAADALLLSERGSVQEMSLPSKLTSYYAVGRPVVAMTRSDGLTGREIANSESGLIVAPGDAPGLLTALGTLRTQPSLAERLVAGGTVRAAALTAQRALISAEVFVEAVEHGSPGLQ